MHASSMPSCDQTVRSGPGPNTAGSEPRRTRVQCGRCLHTLELNGAARRIRCSRCGRQLRLPRAIRQTCAACGRHGEYAAAYSGRPVACRHCGVRVLIPVQLARRVRRRRHGRIVAHDQSLLSLAVSLVLSLLAMLVCMRWLLQS